MAPTDSRAFSPLRDSCFAVATSVPALVAQTLRTFDDPFVAAAAIAKVLSAHGAMSPADGSGQETLTRTRS